MVITEVVTTRPTWRAGSPRSLPSVVDIAKQSNLDTFYEDSKSRHDAVKISRSYIQGTISMYGCKDKGGCLLTPHTETNEEEKG